MHSMRLMLISPTSLQVQAVSGSCTRNDRAALRYCRNAIAADSTEQVAAELVRARKEIGEVATARIQEGDLEGETISFEHADELDRYMRVDHVTSERLFAVWLVSWMSALQATLRLYGPRPAMIELWSGLCEQLSLMERCVGMDVAGGETSSTPEFAVPVPESSEQIRDQWRMGHWTFFVLTQGLIVSLRRLRMLLDVDPALAEVDLDTATSLMWGSGAAMRITGAFTRDEYHQHVRPTMEKGTEQSEVTHTSLSGIMTWDHRVLVDEVWKVELADFFKNVPSELDSSSQRFIDAYRNGLSAGHLEVCRRFGGEKMGSLIAPETVAANTLNKIERVRVEQISGG